IGVLTSALAPGHSGVLERHAAFDVSLAGGELASVSDLQLLNWANGAAVLSDAGVWEILQFRDAQEIAPGTWRLSGLLRGQFGTTDAMASGAAAGASFVLINDRVIAAGLRAGEAGLTLNWRVRPADAGTSAEDAETVRLTGGLRAAMPLAPVHLQARRLADGSVRFSWVRCTRVDGDNWLGSDVPLGEEAEAYLVEIRNEQDNGILHSANTAQPSFVWPSGQVSAARDAGAAQCTATIRQQGRSGPGLPAMHRFALA
ncbi:MAG: hypothetical protein KDH93_06900, partial [Rhodoferax sp.]|nr:hypothetical protein [Rhodoferax sp.]